MIHRNCPFPNPIFCCILFVQKFYFSDWMGWAVKPRYLFSAVAAVCILMVAVLPRFALTAQAGTGQPAAARLEAVAALPTAEQPGSAIAVSPILLPTATAIPEVEDIPAQAQSVPAVVPPPASLPDLDSFAGSLTNGQADTVAGVYAPGLFALPIRQQPAGSSDYIADEDNTVTQYGKPAAFGVTALLAHNTLSGRLFFDLAGGQELVLIYGDGRQARFRIDAIQRYQALSPYDTRSDFADLDHPGAPLLTHSELFRRVYTSGGSLVLQTCIESNGEPTWGRLFIIAEPV